MSCESKESPAGPVTAGIAAAVDKPREQFRQYGKAEGEHGPTEEKQERVRNFYYEQHAKQTYAFVKEMESKYLPLRHRRMTLWEALEALDKVVDESDPDTDLSQTQHALQTAESLRARYPHLDWLHLTGLLHDVGKIINVFNKEPQWAVVGDTFPVGCAFAPENIFAEAFAANPDSADARFNTPLGVYQQNCGLENVKMSWGHDEYMYRVCTDPVNQCSLPREGLYCIRFHSFYPWHRGGGYRQLTNAVDEEMMPWIKLFNESDLYSKSALSQDLPALKKYYSGLMSKYFGVEQLQW